MAVSVLVPLIYITVMEVLLYLSRKRDPLRVLWTSWYRHSRLFSLGALTTVVSPLSVSKRKLTGSNPQLLTSVGKLTVGRLRPHFLAVCRPDVLSNPAVCGSQEQPEFITRYQARGVLLLSLVLNNNNELFLLSNFSARARMRRGSGTPG